MALTGQAKTDYQREYMKRYRANKGNSSILGHKEVSQNAPECPVAAELKSVRPNVSPVRPTDSVRPKSVRPVRPNGMSENQWAYVQMKAEQDG